MEKIMKRRKPEKLEEKKFLLKCEAHGYLTRKMNMAGAYGKVGWPDQAVWADLGIHAQFEFKAVGEGPSDIQLIKHRELKKLGHPVYVVYSCKEAWQKLQAFRAKRLPKRRY